MFKTLFSFFLLNKLKSRNIIILILLGIIPIFLGFLIGIIMPLINQDKETIAEFFPNFTFLVYLHFLVPILSLFLGTEIISEEVENKKLPYLLIQPIPRYFIVLTKYLSHSFIGSVIIIVSLVLSYSISATFFSSSSLTADIGFLVHSGSCLILGLLTYSALFSLLGGILRHPIIISILFVFGWEKIIAYIPGNVRYFTIMNYIQAIFPSFSSSKMIKVSTSYHEGFDINSFIIILLLIISLAGFSSMLLSLKEYPSDLEGT